MKTFINWGSDTLETGWLLSFVASFEALSFVLGKWISQQELLPSLLCGLEIKLFESCEIELLQEISDGELFSPVL